MINVPLVTVNCPVCGKSIDASGVFLPPEKGGEFVDVDCFIKEIGEAKMVGPGGRFVLKQICVPPPILVAAILHALGRRVRSRHIHIRLPKARKHRKKHQKHDMLEFH